MTRPARPGTPARAVRILSVLALVIAACGGGDSSNDPDPTTIGDGSTTEATVGEAEPEEPTQPTQGSSEPGLGAAETMAMLTLGGDTYTFAIVDDGGSCNPDQFGVAFRAILTRVDENGEPVEMPDLEGFTEGISIGLPNEGEAGGLIGGNFGGAAWSAGEDGNEASSIDSASIDGAQAEGTATFVNPETGQAVEGTFEVTCAEGSVPASGEGGDFCADVAASIVMDDDLSLTDPEIERILAQAISEMDKLRSRAPGGIAADVNTLYQSVILMDDIFSGYGYDMTAVPEDEMQRLADPAIQEAGQRLSEYCGFD